MIELSKNELKIVQDILKQYIPNRTVVVFGSRIKGKAKKFSDLDLCIMGDQVPSSETIQQLKQAFSESQLPISVDIVTWGNIDSEFRDVIEQKFEIIQK